MKEEINLLSPGIRRRRVRQMYEHRAMRIYSSVVAGSVIISIAYGSVFGVALLLNDVLSEHLEYVMSEASDIVSQVDTANETLSEFEQFSKRNKSWSPLIEKIMRSVPQGVIVTAIELEDHPPTEEKSAFRDLVIKGNAVSRSAVVLFEQKLRGVSEIGDVIAPLQNLAGNDQGSSFSFTVKRKDV